MHPSPMQSSCSLSWAMSKCIKETFKHFGMFLGYVIDLMDTSTDGFKGLRGVEVIEFCDHESYAYI